MRNRILQISIGLCVLSFCFIFDVKSGLGQTGADGMGRKESPNKITPKTTKNVAKPKSQPPRPELPSKAKNNVTPKKTTEKNKYEQAVDCFNKGDYDCAIANYTKFIELNPNDPEGYNGRSHGYGSKGNYDAAIQDSTKAIELRPRNDHYYINRAKIYKDIKMYNEAIKDFSKAIEIRPNSKYYQTHAMRGEVYEKMGNYQAAIEDFTKEINSRPNPANGANYVRRGRVYYQIGNYSAAISDLTIAIKMSPLDAEEAYAYRGAAYLALNSLNEAIGDFTKALNILKAMTYYFNFSKASHDNLIFNIYYHRGGAYLNKGDYNSAVNDFTNSIVLQPENADAYNARANSYLKLGRKDLADADKQKFQELKKKSEKQ